MAQYPKDLASLIHKRLVTDKAQVPNIEVLNRLVEVMYFASLGTEEGHYVRCWVTYVDPNNPDPDRPIRVRADRWTVSKLARRIPFSERNLAKLAPAADPWSTAIAVYAGKKDELFIWGLIDQGIHKSRISVRESSEGGYPFAGIFELITQGTAEVAAYRNDSLVGRLRQRGIITREHDVLWAGPIYKKLRPTIRSLNLRVIRRVGRDIYETALFDYDTIEEEWLGALSRLLIVVQRYRHGGAILISEQARDLQFKYLLNYARLKDILFDQIQHLVRTTAAERTILDDFLDRGKKRIPMDLYVDAEVEKGDAEDDSAALTGAVHFLGSLSRVDGLIHLKPDLQLTGFGAEVRIETDPGRVFLAQASDPRPSQLSELDAAHFGMRHRSMMRYCASHPKSVGFVISQDGDIRAMTAVGDKLLVWENVMVLHFHGEYMERIRRRNRERYRKSFQSVEN